MIQQDRKPNPYIRYVALGIALFVVIFSLIEKSRPVTRTGTLEFRMVAGEVQGQFQIILLETADRYIILDSAFREILTAEDGELISRPKQLRLLEKYNEIEYRAGFSEPREGLKPVYQTSRELFNEFVFGKPFTYKISKERTDSLTGI